MQMYLLQEYTSLWGFSNFNSSLKHLFIFCYFLQPFFLLQTSVLISLITKSRGLKFY